MTEQYIKIRGTNERNLKNISVDVLRNELAVLIGLSRSGKSSLTFGTIYAEGQRRYTESLSSYACQFLGQVEKPDMESTERLSPAISIDQKSTNRNPRSTMGTVTEIYDYMRLLCARVGISRCLKCGKEIHKQSINQVVGYIIAMPERIKIQFLVPMVRGEKGEYTKVLDQARKSGYVRVRIDGNFCKLSENIELDKDTKHNIEIMMDHLIVKKGTEKRLTDFIETVMALSDGLMTMDMTEGKPVNFSQSSSCPDCGISADEVGPRSFSSDNPFGVCPKCFGLGYKVEFDEDLMIPNRSMSIDDDAIMVLDWQSCTGRGSSTRAILDVLVKEYKLDLPAPFQDHPKEVQDVILYGTGGRKVKVRHKSQGGEGVYDMTSERLAENVNRRYKETFSEAFKTEYESYTRIMSRPVCKGWRPKKESLAATVGGMNVYQAINMPIVKFKDFMDGLKLTSMQQTIDTFILKEIRVEICFLIDVGLDYLSLSRTTGTLSGGEAQKTRLATQIGSGLVGATYALDEPSVGLHQRDNDKLLKTLIHLHDSGNSVLVMEHDEDTILTADCIVGIGPGADEHGEQVIATGTTKQIMADEDPITGAYLGGRVVIPVPFERRKSSGWIAVRGVAENNLENLNMDFPLGVMIRATGVFGSGESSLANEILYKALAKKLNRAGTIPDRHRGTDGTERLDKIIVIDQSLIGRAPRSNPATCTSVFDLICDLFAPTVGAKTRGYTRDHFSFNVEGGWYESCSGGGIIRIEMYFPPDAYVPCGACGEKRYNCETLGIKYKGKGIYDVLDMTMEDTLEFFGNVPLVTRKIQALYNVGLGYVRLGQPSTELSGGEAQRIKLAAELSRRGTGKTIYIPDEPIAELHFAGVHKLIDILCRPSGGGNTVAVIEHNLDAVKAADYIIDIGPEDGDKGETVTVRRMPEEVAENLVSYTDMYIKKYLEAGNKKGIEQTRKFVEIACYLQLGGV